MPRAVGPVGCWSLKPSNPLPFIEHSRGLDGELMRNRVAARGRSLKGTPLDPLLLSAETAQWIKRLALILMARVLISLSEIIVNSPKSS